MMQTKQKTAKARTRVKQIFKEELYKQLSAPSTSAKQKNRLCESQMALFGAWVKRQFNSKNSIPEAVPDSGVLKFLMENPNAVRLTPTQLVEMFNTIPAIRTGLGRIAEETDSVEEDNKAGGSQTELTMAKIGADTDVMLGNKKPLTPTSVGSIEMKAKSLLKAVGDLRVLQPEEVVALTDKFDAVVDAAAEKYIRLLQAAGGDIDKLLPVLSKVSLIPVASIKEAELVALQYLMDLLEEDKIAKVFELLVRDINRDDPKGNIQKTFQNVVAQVYSPEIRRGRGRPAGSKNKNHS